MKNLCFILLLLIATASCKKTDDNKNGIPPTTFQILKATVNDSAIINNIGFSANTFPVIQLTFSASIDTSSIAKAVTFKPGTLAYTLVNDSTLNFTPTAALVHPATYSLDISTALKSKAGGSFQTAYSVIIVTGIDTTDKFARISDNTLLDSVQRATFRYFWDFGHPISGMARERNTSGDVVTTGGSGFGVMSILVGIQRNFVSRADGLARITTIVNFLTNSAQRYHGAFPHWMNGATGATIPFSTNDDGADLVETSYMMEGLLCARQFFSSTTDPTETALRASINTLWNGVEWSWFRQGNQNVLYWHWSADKGWIMNVQIQGWDEALITYALAASANTDSIPAVVYQNGWARNGGIVNNSVYYGITLPVGPNYGGPLFFAHYSFMGINPNSLVDAYANYGTQNTAHTNINYQYCIANPKHYIGYSAQCWGLTASDEQNGYSAHAPDNDNGTISPTAALSSMPYNSTASLAALRFFYYKLGDKIWGQYGFTDAFNLTNVWFANSYLAIDQGPEIVMIENYRSGMMWNLFMSCPEVKRGMHRLGFTSPFL